MKRTLYFGNPAHLATKNEQLIIKRDNHSDTTIPIEDIGFVILDHYDISITKTILQKLTGFIHTSSSSTSSIRNVLIF
jgi:CRISPR-associated protein Cas1